MANVSGQSAQVVSDQMTAVWNNFAKGSDNLEHFADVMVRLGADTASSSDEIAQGLEKFAAVSDTVGLSYEHAAAALATVTATTRQSADVVGTAFKTIFARMEGLKLGETLDDGTTLNQYSEALLKAGVSIKDANGELKDMDTILDETMAKWDSLGRDQQIALAQQVAGIRQYQQFIALMDNADFFKENLARAQGADGSLQEQADIYAESWEASSKNVQAAWEDVYDSLFDETAFIKMNNVLAGIADTLSGLVDSFGGLGGVLQLVGAIFLQHFSRQMPAILTSLKQNLMVFIGQGQKVANQQRAEMNAQFSEITNNQNLSASIRSEAEGLREVNSLKMELANNSQYMTNQQRTEIEGRIQLIQSIRDEITAMEKEAEAYRNTAAVRASSQKGVKDRTQANSDYRTYLQQAEDYGAIRFGLGIDEKTRQWGSNAQDNVVANKPQAGQVVANAQKAVADASNVKEVQAAAQEYGAAMKAVVNSTKPVSQSAKDTSKDLLELIDKFEQTGQEAKDTSADSQDLKQALNDLLDDIIRKAGEYANKINESANKDQPDQSSTRSKLHNNGVDTKSEEFQQESNKAMENGNERAVAEANAAQNSKRVSDRMKELNVPDKTQALTQFASAVMSVQMAFSAFQNAWTVFSNSDSTFLDKLGATMGVVTTVIFGFTSVTTAATTIQALFKASTLSAAKATAEEGKEHVKTAGSKIAETIATMGLTSASLLLLAAIVAIIAVIALLVIAFQKMKQNSPEEQIKRIDQNIQDLKQNIEDTTSKIEDLSSSFDNLKSAEDTLKGLKKGSLEWFEQMAKIQDIVNHLLELFPDLQNYIKYDENGMPYFEEGAKDAVADRLFQQRQGDRVAVGMEEKRKSDLNLDSAFEKRGSFRQEMKDYFIERTAPNIVGIDKETKRQYKDNIRLFDDEEFIKDFFNSHIGWSPEAFRNALLERLGMDPNKQTNRTWMDNMLSNYTIGIEEYSKAFLESTQAMSNAAQQTAAALVASTNDIDSAEYGDVLQDKTAQMISEATKEILNNLNSEDTKIRDEAREEGREEWEASHAAGIENYKFKKYTNEGMEYTYIEDGETKTATAEWSELAGAVAMSAEKIEEYKNKIVAINGDLSKLDNMINSSDPNISQEQKDKAEIAKNIIVEGNVDNLTKNEFEQLKSQKNASDLGLSDDYQQDIDKAITATEQAWEKLNAEASALNLNINTMTQEQATAYISQSKNIADVSAAIQSQIDWMQDHETSPDFNINTLFALDDAKIKLEDFQQQLNSLASTSSFGTISENLNRLGVDANDIMAGNLKTLEDFEGATDEEKAQKYAQYLGDMADSAERFAQATNYLDADGIINDEEAKTIGMTSEEFESYVDELYEYEKAQAKAQGREAKSRQSIAETAEEALQAAKSLDKLRTTWKNYGDVLKQGPNDKNMGKWAKAISEVKKSMSEILKIDSDVLSDNFYTENMELVEKIINGSAEEAAAAIDQLRGKAADDIILGKLRIENPNATLQEAQEVKNSILDLFNNEDFKIEGKLDISKIGPALQQMLGSMNYTVGEAQALMAGLGYKMIVKPKEGVMHQTTTTPASYYPQVTYKPVIAQSYDATPGKGISKKEIRYAIPQVTYSNIPPAEAKTESTAAGVAVDVESSDGKMLSMNDVEIQDVEPIDVGGGQVVNAPTYTPSTPTSPSGDGGGGGSQADLTFADHDDYTEPKEAEDEIERYHEIVETVDDYERALDRVSAKKDEAFGAAKLKYMDEEIEKIKNLISLNDQYMNEIAANMESDKAKLITFGVQFDDEGRINNYDEVIQQQMDKWKADMDAITDERNQIYIQQNELEKQEDSNEKRQAEHDLDEQLKVLDKREEEVDKTYEQFKNGIEQYEETRDLYFDTLVEQEEKVRQLVQAQLDRIREKYEIEITVNETQFKIIDHYLDKYGKDIRDFSKAFREGIIKSFDSDKMESLFHQISTSQSITDEIITKFLTDPNMTHDKLAEELQTRIDADIENLETIQEIVDYQLELYGEMVDSASEILQRYIDKMDSMLGQMETYKEMSTLLGWDKDYDTMNKYYDAQQAAIDATIASAKGVVDMYTDEFNDIAYRFENKMWDNETERQMLENKYWAAYDKKIEAEEYLNQQILKSGEIAQERLTMALEKAAEDFQRGLFQGQLSDDFMTELDRLNAKQEDYLTKTNQMYETNKLIRQAQLDMDKTENKQAKQRYNQYIQHIQQLQDKNKMSQFALSVAQAEYEVLKAQIALEEAQQAKNQVRLTRDANGNFGYVYTANQDNINEAEQALEDAKNGLYNVALEGTQNYQEQFWNLRQEAAQTLQDINERYQSHEITVEEYNRLIAEATEYYTEREKDITEEYHDAYDLLNKTSYEKKADYDLKGIDSTKNFANSVNGYIETSKNAFDTFGRETQHVLDALGGSMSGFIGKVNGLTGAIQNLGEVLRPVVDDLGTMLHEVRDSTSTWAQNYGGKIEDYEKQSQENMNRDYELFEDFARPKSEGGYSAEMMKYIQEKLSSNNRLSNLDYIMDQNNIATDADVQAIWAYLTARWKDGGQQYDEHQDYTALLEQTTDPMEKLMYGILRRYKILNTDWMSKIQQAINEGFTLEDFELDALLRNRKEKNRLLGLEDNTYNEVLAIFERLGKNPYPNNKPYGYDTGGYTGSWGPTGKIGILHQKELVLNQDDTKNLLQSVSIVRDISDVLDRSVRNMALSTGTDLKAALVGAFSDQVLQQQVTIEAQFPNVTDHNEIERAIDDLINSASQFAYR